MDAKLKVDRIAKSLGAMFPGEIANALGIEKGDTLFLTAAPGGYRLTARDPAFEAQMGRARTIMSNRRKALRKLAK